MRGKLAVPTLLLLGLVLGGCTQTGPGDVAAGIAEAVGGAAAETVAPLTPQYWGASSNTYSTQAGQAHAKAAGLRHPRELRGLRTLRSPRPYGQNIGRPTYDRNGPVYGPRTDSSATYNAQTGNVSLTAGGTRYTFSNQGNTILVGPGPTSGTLYGSTPSNASLLYDPLTDTWSWQ